MECVKCGNEMILDDRDYNFKGCYDNYFLCEECHCGCRELVRYGRTIKVIWDFSEG